MMFVKNNESGITLVEVVASLVIITIILVSFFSFFMNTAKTTKTANHIFDATYYAQKEMEGFYNLTQTTVIHKDENKEQQIKQAIVTKGYEPDENNSGYFKKEGDVTIEKNNVFNYKLKIIDIDKTLTRFTIYVCDKEKSCGSNTAKAQMENIYEWRAR
ncbi:Tfp pilus assembly protein PilV [Lysinibacillus parviboronicapiens]|uniref:Tfp pilus assembly protein PilV n=2 Tax=Lysinibacillus parviboronicapiens TaxID=436516 RepID=A0ABV2PDK6_9BACI|nr:prepilin-type N-terminal cleavage/methylation domain-containing protein [Lysinibacillus parviboronicapiens]